MKISLVALQAHGVGKYPGIAHGSQRVEQKCQGNGDEQAVGCPVPGTRYLAGLSSAFHGSFEMQPCRRESLSQAPPFAFRPHGIREGSAGASLE